MKTYCQRPDNHTELTDRNVHQLVKPEDILIHVGDIGMGKPETWLHYTKNWPGLKWLVRGNHDQKGCQWYVQNAGFHMACDALLYRGVWITHKPSPFLPPGAQVNVHGHLHNVWHGFGENDPESSNPEFYSAFKNQHLELPFQRLLAHEYVNYAPVDFDKFVAKPDKYQARGPNEETKKYLRLKQEDADKCSSCIGEPNGTV
jgi:calcineurin-like phosphoesterase family protein